MAGVFFGAPAAKSPRTSTRDREVQERLIVLLSAIAEHLHAAAPGNEVWLDPIRGVSVIVSLPHKIESRCTRHDSSICVAVRRTRRPCREVSSAFLVQRRMTHAASLSWHSHMGGSARSAYAGIRPRDALTAQGTWVGHEADDRDR